MKKNIILCLIAITLSCSGSKETPAYVYDLSFTCPAGWNVTEKNDYGDSKYISIEKNGLSESGLVMITYTDEEFELPEYMEIYRDLFKEQKVMSGIVFDEIKMDYYGQYEGLVCDYTVSIMSIPHEGRFYTFYANGKTVCVTEQEAVEDKVTNKDGFEKIKETLIFN